MFKRICIFLQRSAWTSSIRTEKLAKVEENIVNNFNFTPGGHAKKWDPAGVDFARFLERQQAVMCTRTILAARFYGEYAPVPKQKPVQKSSGDGGGDDGDDY